MIDAERPLSRPFAFHAMALLLALACSSWALFGGGPQQRLSATHLIAVPANDMQTHFEFVAAAAESQGHGWPYLREVPRVANSPIQGYPLFQFYSFLPYHLPALALRAGLDPYLSLLAGVLFSFALGTWAMAGFARSQGLGPWPSLLAAAAFCLAPYHLTDLYGRFAYAELFAFGLLPCVFWSLDALVKRPSLGAWLLNSLAWASLILSHHAFHVWGVLLALVWARLAYPHRVKAAAQVLAPLSAYVAGLGLALFFFAPVLALGTQMVAGSMPVPHHLSPLPVLLQPFLAVNGIVRQTAPLLGLQVGWALLLPALWLTLRGGPPEFRAAWWLFLACILLAAAPYALWACLGPLREVLQFPYRLLTFIDIFGALLLAHAVQGRLGLWTFGLAVLALALWGLSWKQVLPTPGTEVAEAASGYQRNGVDFRTSLMYALLPQAMAQRPEDDRSQSRVPGTELRVTRHLWYPGLYDVRLAGGSLPYGYVNGFLAVRVPPGSGPIEVRFRGLPWANAISAVSAVLWAVALAAWAVLRIKKRRA